MRGRFIGQMTQKFNKLPASFVVAEFGFNFFIMLVLLSDFLTMYILPVDSVACAAWKEATFW